MNGVSQSDPRPHVVPHAPLAGTFLPGNIFTLAAVLIVTAFAYLMLFYRLDAMPLHLWDESRLAVNAIEMATSQNPFVTTYDGAPDLWNTKPPLLIWIMSGLLTRLHSPELAIRLPSAISALLTAFILLWFCTSFLNDRIAGLLSALVLLSSNGFVGGHAGRTGDYDALLALWITIYSLSYFAWFHNSGMKREFYLGVCTIAVTLAIFTKGIAALVPLPALLLYTILQGRFKEIVSSRELYASAVVVIAAASTLYFAREYHNSGYLQAVLTNEITGRYFFTNEGHDGFYFYYVYKMLGGRFSPWILWLVVSLPALLLFCRGPYLSAVLFSACFIAVFLFVLEMGRTKMPWYAVPVYPFASLVIGLGVSKAARSLNRFSRGSAALTVLLGALLGASMTWSVYQHLPVVQAEDHDQGRLMYGSYFRYLRHMYPSLTSYKVVDGDTPFYEGDDGHYQINAPLLFYVKVANRSGYDLQIVADDENMDSGDRFVTCDETSLRRIKREYQIEIKDSNGDCYLGAIRLRRISNLLLPTGPLAWRDFLGA